MSRRHSHFSGESTVYRIAGGDVVYGGGVNGSGLSGGGPLHGSLEPADGLPYLVESVVGDANEYNGDGAKALWHEPVLNSYMGQDGVSAWSHDLVNFGPDPTELYWSPTDHVSLPATTEQIIDNTHAHQSWLDPDCQIENKNDWVYNSLESEFTGPVVESAGALPLIDTDHLPWPDFSSTSNDDFNDWILYSPRPGIDNLGDPTSPPALAETQDQHGDALPLSRQPLFSDSDRIARKQAISQMR